MSNVPIPLVSIAEVAGLSADSPADDLLAMKTRIKFQQDELRKAAAMLEKIMIDNIQAHGQITVGDIRYYVGPESDTKLQEGKLEAAVDAVLTAVGGDMAKFAGCLSTGAFKPGACEKTLDPDAFNALFVTTTQTDLKTGKPLKKLRSVDMRFVRSQPDPVDQAS